jgi:ribonucleoside-diphosphate reductase beta chain
LNINVATDFSYQEDAKDYAGMQSDLAFMYLKNLKFQQMADSVAARSVAECFIPCTTNPQLETWWYQHAFFESNVHTQTYAEIVKALPINAKDVFDSIMIDQNILRRAQDVMVHFEALVIENSKMILRETNPELGYNIESHKATIALALYALNILEAILFKSSFITTFAFKENGLMSSTGDSIKKILLDEIGHYSMTVNLINRLRADPEWIHIFASIEPRVLQMYSEAVGSDHAWVDHLFEDGVIILGISSDSLKGYVDYNAKVVMTSIGLKPLKEEVFNTCIWAKKYSKSSNVQTAQKEKNSANYLLGTLDTYVSNEDWDSFIVKEDQ